MRKIIACWACGHTFWAWRLRERNFCSGKCRVRHHRSPYRKPAPHQPSAKAAPPGYSVRQSQLSALAEGIE